MILDELIPAEAEKLFRIVRPLEALFAERAPKPPGAEALRVERLCLDGVFRDVSFALRAGEIVGMAGLVGAGQSERSLHRVALRVRLRLSACGHFASH
ncbi:MAG: hypothetical protein U1E59_12635 [Amaricoccus sp.]